MTRGCKVTVKEKCSLLFAHILVCYHPGSVSGRNVCKNNKVSPEQLLLFCFFYLFQEFSVSLGGLLDQVSHSPALLARHHHTCLSKRHCHLHYGTIQAPPKS